MTGLHSTAYEKKRPLPASILLILLFPIAMFAVGCGGAGASGPADPSNLDPPWFEEIAASSGLDFRYENGYD